MGSKTDRFGFISGSTLSSYVSLDKLLNLSELPFSYLRNRTDHTCLEDCRGEVN